MSEGVQIRVSRPSRAERTTTSCGECRRRKQKCNQGQPCSNCSRRFPQPLCEYKTSPRRTGNVGGTSSNSQERHFKITIVPPPFPDGEPVDYVGIREPMLPSQPETRPASWEPSTAEAGGVVASWTGVDIVTQFPGSSAVVPMGNNWATLPGMQLSPTEIPACEPNCMLHPDAVHDAFRVLRTIHAVPDRFKYDWGQHSPDDLLSWLSDPLRGGSVPVLGPAMEPMQDLNQLPLQPTKLNAELLRIYVNLISRFKACLDGDPDPNNPYTKYYVPYCVQAPLLAQIAIYTAACFLNETGHLSKTVSMAHKGQAIRMLNEHLLSGSSTSDDAIVGVTQLIVDEWYWGETQDLRAHLRGLRQMIRLRGGFRNLGMNGLLSKIVISSDIVIALSFEIAPFLRNGVEFEFHESGQLPFRLAHNTPFVAPLVPFAACAEALKLHPLTASILDDMRFMISTVLGLSDEPSEKELRKVRSTSAWIHERISKLPLYSPVRQQQPCNAPDLPNTPQSVGSPGEGEDSRVSRNGKSETMPAELGNRPRPSADAQSAYISAVEHKFLSPNSKLADQPKQRGAKQLTPRSGSPAESGASGATPEPEAPDFLYQAVRQAALVYSRAVMLRQPFRTVVSPAEFFQLWTMTWRVPLTTWKSMAGVFGWIMLAIAPSSHNSAHSRMVKSMLSISVTQVCLENWEIAYSMMQGGLKLQWWLGTKSASVSPDAHVDVTSENQPCKSGTTLSEAKAAEDARIIAGGPVIEAQGSVLPKW